MSEDEPGTAEVRHVDAREPGDRPTYYDRPVLKEPVWIWSVPAYFFVGGAAGACALLGAFADGDDDLAGLARSCRIVSASGTTVGTVLLIIDLGRPERFLNMLRVFRPTSPMSVGSWILAASSGAASAWFLLSEREGITGTVGRLSGVAAGVLGMPLAGYTAVLVANTAVPAWHGARRSLPALFMASSVAGGAGLLALTDVNEREAEVVRWMALAGGVGELVAETAVVREAGKVARVARPYEEGTGGTLWKAAKTATGLGLVATLLSKGRRWLRIVGGALGVLGALVSRFAVFEAGKASSRDPQATFQQQRSGRGAAEATGRSAVSGPGERAS